MPRSQQGSRSHRITSSCEKQKIMTLECGQFICRLLLPAGVLSFNSRIQFILLTITMAKSTITLASGKEMPLVGFGLWKVPKETAADTVYNVSISSVLT